MLAERNGRDVIKQDWPGGLDKENWVKAVTDIENAFAPEYDKKEFEENPALTLMAEVDLKTVLDEFELQGPIAGKKYLVGGTGPGREVIALLERGAEVFGVDIAEEYFNIVREKYEKCKNGPGLPPTARLNLKLCPLEEVTIEPGSLAGASSLFGVMNHVKDWWVAIENIAQGLKPGAPFVASFYGSGTARVFSMLKEGKIPYQPSVVQRRVPGGIVLGESEEVLPAGFPSVSELVTTFTGAGCSIKAVKGLMNYTALHPNQASTNEDTLIRYAKLLTESPDGELFARLIEPDDLKISGRLLAHAEMVDNMKHVQRNIDQYAYVMISAVKM